MNCQICKTTYSSFKPSIPRILVACGHTACQKCIEQTFSVNQIECPQCGVTNFGNTLNQYPINATLISFLQKDPICKTHNQKLEAYCQKDNQLLCLSCVLGSHKNHKISSVSEKVAKDRQILQQCMQSINESRGQINKMIKFCEANVQKIENEYKDHLLQIGLCFSNINAVLKQVQNKYLTKTKVEYQGFLQKHQKHLDELKERQEFMQELTQIYEQVISLPNIQYLNEDNKRLFIIQNCKFKKLRIDQSKPSINRLLFLTDIQNAIQQMFSYEKKLQGQSTPTLKAKKSTKSKEPTVLEVNLNQQYKKHFKNSEYLPNFNKQKIVKQKMVSTSNQISKTPKKQNQFCKKQAIALSASSQFDINTSFQTDSLHLSMINSFMESSRHSHSLSIRNSEDEFTIMNFDSKIYHIGGFNETSVQTYKQDSQQKGYLFNSNIHICKAQCAILPVSKAQTIFLFGGKSSEEEKVDAFVEYNMQTNVTSLTSFKLSEPKSGFGSFVRDGKLYVIGGSNDYQSLKSFQEYKIAENKLLKTDYPNMNFSRDEFGLVFAFDGFAYACGGINESGSVLASCQRYNWTKSKWENIASMNKPRRSFALVALPHGIYAIGGYDGHNCLADVELYDFSKCKWIQVKSMSYPRFAHTALVTQDLQRVIVSGGFNQKALKSVEYFDIIDQKWIDGPSMHMQRFLHCSLVINL